MSKITLDKDKYFIEVIDGRKSRFDIEKENIVENKIMIPARNITDIQQGNAGDICQSIDSFYKYPYKILIDYYNRGLERNANVCYKTKKERDKDWDKLKNLERIR